MDGAISIRPHDRDDASAGGRRAGGSDFDPEFQRSADAARDRLSSLVSDSGLPARSVDGALAGKRTLRAFEQVHSDRQNRAIRTIRTILARRAAVRRCIQPGGGRRRFLGRGEWAASFGSIRPPVSHCCRLCAADAECSVFRADDGDHECVQPGSRRNLQRVAVDRPGRDLDGKFLDSNQRILVLLLFRLRGRGGAGGFEKRQIDRTPHRQIARVIGVQVVSGIVGR
jgi:hypothetical protein